MARKPNVYLSDNDLTKVISGLGHLEERVLYVDESEAIKRLMKRLGNQLRARRKAASERRKNNQIL